MITYIVASDRLAGFRRGDIVNLKDLEGVNIEALLDAGHLSTYAPKKPAKTKDTETEKD